MAWLVKKRQSALAVEAVHRPLAAPVELVEGVAALMRRREVPAVPTKAAPLGWPLEAVAVAITAAVEEVQSPALATVLGGEAHPLCPLVALRSPATEKFRAILTTPTIESVSDKEARELSRAAMVWL